MIMHYKNAETKMEESIKVLSNNLVQVRTGRANTSILDDVRVEYYGAMTPLNQIASLSVSEGSQLIVKPYDANSLKDVEKAVHQADLGLNPINDGTVIRINIPTLTEEVRKGIVKDVSKMGEEAKIVIRNIRRDANTGINNDDGYTEDDERSELKRIQDLTDKYTDKIDKMIDKKSAEVMTI